MIYCERCGEADCCERLDLPTEPILCDACYEKATREKLIEVFMHIGDHITNRDEYGICFDTPLAEAIEDVLAMLKSQDANGVTVQEWISIEAGELKNYIGVPVCIKRKTDGACWWAIIRGIKGDKVSTDYGGYFLLSEYGKTWSVKYFHLPQPPKGE